MSDPTHVSALFEGPLTFETMQENIPTFRQEGEDISEVYNTRNIVIENELLNLNCIMQRQESQTMSMKPPTDGIGNAKTLASGLGDVGLLPLQLQMTTTKTVLQGNGPRLGPCSLSLCIVCTE